MTDAAQTLDEKQLKTLLQQALGSINRGDAASAESILHGILAAKPEEPDALQLLGLLRQVQGSAEAEALYRRSLAAKPDQPQVWNNLGKLLRGLNRVREAIVAFREAVRVKPNFAEGHLNLGIALSDLDDFTGAEKSYREALRLQPNFVMAKQSLVAALTKQGRAQEAESLARQTLAQAAHQPRQTAALQHNLAIALSEQHKHEEALRYLASAQANAPDMPMADTNRGNILQQMGRLEEAADSYERALARNPLDFMAHAELNRLLYRLGREDAFLKSYDDAAAGYPRHPALPLDKAGLLLKSERFALAKENFERAIQIDPLSVTAHDGLGLALAQLNEFEASARAHEKAVALEPDNANAWTNYALTLLRARKSDKALFAAERALDAEPHNQNALAVWGLALQQLGDEREPALNDYDSFVQIFDLEPPEGFSDIETFNHELNATLDSLHRDRHQPLDQTLRGGTQTLHHLFGSGHALVEKLRAPIDEAVTAYIARMRDSELHPLLSRRTKRFALRASWSSRLSDCGFHTNHVHPKGWISSAYYVSLPGVVAGEEQKQGWIKFGEPPAEIGDSAPYRRAIQPKPGRLVLFPSYMWHGTVPFQSKEARTTIAFDVVPR
jgi:tetratricopeptide (TPR) repeat protein